MLAHTVGVNYEQDTKTQLPLLRCQEQKQGTVNAPCTHHHQRGGQTTPLAWPLDPPLPSPHIRDQLASTQGVSKGTCYLFLFSPAAARVPVRPCLNLKSPRTWVSCTDACYNMNESWEHYARWKKNQTQKATMLYDSIFMKGPKLANSQRQKVG